MSLSVVLVLPPLRYHSSASDTVRPDGALGLPYLVAALRRAGHEAKILDGSVGTDTDTLHDTFFREQELPDGLVQIGLTNAAIAELCSGADIIGVSSIFSPQTSAALSTILALRAAHPSTPIVAGGVNARSQPGRFLVAGATAIFMSEAEDDLVDFARAYERGEDWRSTPGIAYAGTSSKIVTSPPRKLVNRDLDALAPPAWDALPNAKYWELGRIWGGRHGWVEPGEPVRYASILTSRGCPFRCSYCHISKEDVDDAGNIAKLRLHSIERVAQELALLQDLSVTHLYINDDSFLARRDRVMAILATMSRFRFKIADVNGVNIAHLFRHVRGERVVDDELIEALHAAGFKRLTIPFESGSARIIRQYSSDKWSPEAHDIPALVGALRRAGIATHGNFMIGFPGETSDELRQTFALAREVESQGVDEVSYFPVQAYPGSALFDDENARGAFGAGIDTDAFLQETGRRVPVSIRRLISGLRGETDRGER